MGYDIEKEKREAIEAGRRALNSLQAAKENLNSAKNWGDMPLVKQTGEISKGKRQKYLHFILECMYFYAHHFSLYFLIRLFSGLGYSTGMSDFSAS